MPIPVTATEPGGREQSAAVPAPPAEAAGPGRAAEPTASVERAMTGLTDAAVRDLVGELAARFDELAPGDTSWGQHPEPAAAPLNRLRVLAHLMRAVDRCAAQEAAAAVRLGANYPRLGQAWGITRQGARRRWPGLVFTSNPPSRPLMIRSDPMNALTPRRTYSVLLVEDDPADALLIEDALSEGGMTRQLSHVGDGIEALEYLRDPEHERPDLIVLDLNMPRMNGREFLAVLRDDDELGSIPLVVLTTSAAPDDIADAYQKHANAYVTKPVNLDDFLEAVQRIDAFFLETSATLPAPGE
ncbi:MULTISPECIES: response regulator [unclassified Streptomyces]|uniref:response regulator n=1 Tax=unclassified Streptomyces TaxID=2593676 RepID=UPI0033B5FEDA